MEARGCRQKHHTAGALILQQAGGQRQATKEAKRCPHPSNISVIRELSLFLPWADECRVQGAGAPGKGKVTGRERSRRYRQGSDGVGQLRAGSPGRAGRDLGCHAGVSARR